MQNALQISEQQSSDFAGSLPEGFHKTIQKRVKTMEVMKKAVTVKEEADITLINYMLQAAGAGAPTICILSNDTDVFVLVYWVWKANVHSAVQMEKWDGTILDKNARVSWGSMPYQDVILYPTLV